MSGKGFEQLDAAAASAVATFTERTGWQPVDLRTPSAILADIPFVQYLRSVKDREAQAAEAVGEASELGDYEMEQRAIGALAVLDYACRGGLHPADVLRWLAAVGRAMHRAPWSELTMHEMAMLEGQTPAAHSFRCKVISGEIKLQGMKGTQMPGQKSEGAVKSYQVARKGNTNRAPGRKINGKKIRTKTP